MRAVHVVAVAAVALVACGTAAAVPGRYLRRTSLQALVIPSGLTAAQNPLAGVTYDVLGLFPAGSREVADPLDAFGGIDVAYRAYVTASSGKPQLYPSELSDGGNITWGNATADGNGVVNMAFPSIRFDNLAASFGNYLFNVQGWAIGQL